MLKRHNAKDSERTKSRKTDGQMGLRQLTFVLLTLLAEEQRDNQAVSASNIVLRHDGTV
jgi:hypothetical protein